MFKYLTIGITAVTADIIKILEQYGESTVSKIRANMHSTGTDATGKTSKSLRFEVKQEGSKLILNILGKKFITVIETGRKPTPDKKPSKQFVESVREWVKAKGVDASPYAIANAINKHGSKLYQSGGRQDIFSNVINKSLFDDISKSILKSYANQVSINIKNVYGNSVK